MNVDDDEEEEDDVNEKIILQDAQHADNIDLEGVN